MQRAGQVPIKNLHAKKRRRLALIAPDFNEYRWAICGQRLEHPSVAFLEPEKPWDVLVEMLELRSSDVRCHSASQDRGDRFQCSARPALDFLISLSRRPAKTPLSP